MGKEIYLKDFIANKTYDQLISLLPFRVCEVEDDTMISYRVAGFGHNSIVLLRRIVIDDEDNMFSDREEDVATILNFSDIDSKYIVANQPTSKQKNFLKIINQYSVDMTGYQAYHIIHDYIEEQNQRRIARENEYEEDYADCDDFDPYEGDPWF